MSMKVHYPNRRLGLQYAATRPEDAYEPNCMANIALANLQVGDIVRVYRDETWTVARIDNKAIVFYDKAGQEHRYAAVSGGRWDGFVRDVGGALLASIHGADCGDLMNALSRDPTHILDRDGVHCIADVYTAPQEVSNA